MSLMAGNARHSLSQKFVWLVVLLTAVTSVMPVVVVRFLKMYLYPSLSDQVCLRYCEYLKDGWWLS
jgi:hypothetical protein